MGRLTDSLRLIINEYDQAEKRLKKNPEKYVYFTLISYLTNKLGGSVFVSPVYVNLVNRIRSNAMLPTQ